jgi:hypothetical protein
LDSQLWTCDLPWPPSGLISYCLGCFSSGSDRSSGL